MRKILLITSLLIASLGFAAPRQSGPFNLSPLTVLPEQTGIINTSFLPVGASYKINCGISSGASTTFPITLTMIPETPNSEISNPSLSGGNIEEVKIGIYQLDLNALEGDLIIQNFYISGTGKTLIYFHNFDTTQSVNFNCIAYFS